jgi:fructose-specific phosphotransferase system IIC component
VTASFPGLGEPRISGTYSDVAITSNMNVNSPLFQLHNTDPGWIALALGIVALLAGAAYLWLPQRKIAAVAVAVLGAIAGVICVSHFFDVRATFGNPPNLADVNFSPGAGLVAACILSFSVTALGVWAYITETRSSHSHY